MVAIKRRDFPLPHWLTYVVLAILALEGSGAITGGVMLIAQPEGSLFGMNPGILNGVFDDFLYPGIALLLLGLLQTAAFGSVLFNRRSAWLLTALAFGAFAIWFVVEILVLREMVWLQLVWGYPVYAGFVAAVPMMTERLAPGGSRRGMLLCGALSSLWYIAINVIVPFQDDTYRIASFTVSELSAIGAPTRMARVLLLLPYSILYAVFGWAVILISEDNHRLKIAGILTVMMALFGFFWPPMHMRGEAMGLTDTLHIAWAMVTLLLMMLTMSFGAAAQGKGFRVYTAVTFVIFVVFGALIGTEAPGIARNEPTPFIGIWERINMSAFFIWVMIFSITLARMAGIREQKPEQQD